MPNDRGVPTLADVIGYTNDWSGQLEKSQQAKDIEAYKKQLAMQQQAESLKTAQGLIDQYGAKGKKVTIGLGDTGSVNMGESEMDPLGAQFGKALQGSQITGFNVTNPNKVIPTPKDAEEVKGATAGFKAMAQGKNRLQNLLQNANPLDRLGAVQVPILGVTLGTQKGREMDAEIGDLLMQGKNLEKLGALQASEIKLMERIQGGTTGAGSLIQSKEDVIQRLNDLITRARSRVQETAQSRGYTSQPGYLDVGGEFSPKPIRVKHKASGQTGTIPSNEFDPNIYEQIQ